MGNSGLSTINPFLGDIQSCRNILICEKGCIEKISLDYAVQIGFRTFLETED